jgi:hypothetical protein
MNFTLLEHVWQTQGLGRAPFKIVGYWSAPSKSLQEHNPEAYNNAMRASPKCCNQCCAHCGTGIMHHCIIKSSDGEVFAVGSDCVAKTGDTRLISQAKAHKNKMARERAAVKRASAQLARQEARAIELQAERDRNGGLTDYEATQAELSRQRARRYKIASPIATVLKAQNSNFCDNLIRSIMDGHNISPRAQTIITEIMTKQYGRMNSKSYDAHYEEMSTLVTEILEVQL